MPNSVDLPKGTSISIASTPEIAGFEKSWCPQNDREATLIKQFLPLFDGIVKELKKEFVNKIIGDHQNCFDLQKRISNLSPAVKWPVLCPWSDAIGYWLEYWR